MNALYPDEISSDDGSITVKPFQLTHRQVQHIKMRDAINGRSWQSIGLKHDHTYIGFYRQGNIWMSDTPMEKRTNRPVINHAAGDVLILGMGMGLVLPPLLQAPEIQSITVIEVDEQVISLVLPQLQKHYTTDNLNIIHGDGFHPEKHLPKNARYDYIWFDIWQNICADNWEEIKMLQKKYKSYLNPANPKATTQAWLEDYIRLL